MLKARKQKTHTHRPVRGKEIFNMSEVFNNNEFSSDPNQHASNS